jgi:hypothetical protein
LPHRVEIELMRHSFQVQETFVFDPAFTKIDLKALERLGVSIIVKNEVRTAASVLKGCIFRSFYRQLSF